MKYTLLLISLALSTCAPSHAGEPASRILIRHGQSPDDWRLPDGRDPAQWHLLPQDPNNRLTVPGVELGRLAFHDDTLQGLAHRGGQAVSCATCHDPDHSYHAGVPQGIGEGGFHHIITGDHIPDRQPVRTPGVFGAQYYADNLCLVNGLFGNLPDSPNGGLQFQWHPAFGFPMRAAHELGKHRGLEQQAIGGQIAHRLRRGPVLSWERQVRHRMRGLGEEAFGKEKWNTEDPTYLLGLAMAQWETTVTPVAAPLQISLRTGAPLTKAHSQGLETFLKLDCIACHNPERALTGGFERLGDSNGHADLDGTHDLRGRADVTFLESDHRAFRVPTLYNCDRWLGHGAQTPRTFLMEHNSHLGQPISDEIIADLMAFLASLQDPDLGRHSRPSPTTR